MAKEVQGSLGEISEIYITRLCKMRDRSHDDQPAGSSLKQRISMTLQIDNAACVLGIVSDRDAFEELFYIVVLEPVYHCSFSKFLLPVYWDSGWNE